MRDYSGMKFNELTLIEDLGPGRGTRGRWWLAACSCGNVASVIGKDVAAGRVKRCNNCVKGLTEKRGGYRARSAEEARGRWLYTRMSRKALREGKEFALSFNDIMTMDLRYCRVCTAELKLSTMTMEIVDPTGAYTVENVAPICSICKRRMGKDNLPQFLTYLARTILALNNP